MKKILSILICSVIIISFTVPCFAWTPYGNVTDNTSQIDILIDAMLNDAGFNVFQYWVAFRDAENSYYIYFNIDQDDNTACYYHYYSTQSGYNTLWHLERNDSNNFRVPDLNTYTCVGNLPTYTLRSEKYSNFCFLLFIEICAMFCAFGILFFCFRIRKRGVLV